MSSLKIKIANFFAKNSCSKWQKNRAIRKCCRSIYRSILETKAIEYPYGDDRFANWPESDDAENYTLVSDSDGFVIRHPTSYLAWKIRQETGKRLVKPVPGPRKPGEHAFDAKHWDELLEYNGWKRYDNTKEIEAALGCGISFVGILPEYGEFGLLVWLWTAGYDYYNNESWLVDTYLGGDETTIKLNYNEFCDYIWYGNY